MSHNGTILIIEDNEMSLKMAKSLLQLAGYNTLEADNADTGILLAREHQPSLILMDMHLPLKSGYEASRELKSSPETGSIPIVAFTALAMQEEQQRALSHGCAGVISKPIDIKRFAETVKSFLDSDPPIRADGPDVTAQQAEPMAHDTGCPQCVDALRAKQDFEEFLFHVSHDLQGPLRKIQQFSKFLELPATDAADGDNETQAYCQGIYRSAKDMESILQDLLTLSRVNRKGEAFSMFSLNDAVLGALSRYRYEIQDCGAKVEVGVLPSILGDPAQMRMVFEELLENALKFKTDGQPPVIRIQGSKPNNAMCEITVEDNGIGITERAAERIFKPFMRLNGASRYPGHGIGLAIVKKIIDRHGGSISALSKPGISTVISIRLPFAPQAD